MGYSDTSLTLDCARALAESGAAEIAVHARTKMDGYKPPAHWEWIARIREVVRVPVIANGEVWDQVDHHRIQAISGCESVMIGRGLVVQPDLALRISCERAGQPVEPMNWQALLPWIADFFTHTRARMIDRHSPGRIK
ncbi:MAG: tRNA-dihydrouridine synthase family protein, partial [Halopseudomonas sp.]